MAMFECPGCKHIVDDSIKKCPNCSYDIKKYVKAMMKDAKKNGKTINESSLALSSVYSSDNAKGGALPKLDFLSEKPTLPSLTANSAQPGGAQPLFDSPSLNAAAANMGAASAAPKPTFESPSLNAAAAPKPTFESPSLNAPVAPAAPTQMFDSPSLNGTSAPTTFSAPGFTPVPVPANVEAPSFSMPEVSAPVSTFETPSLAKEPEVSFTIDANAKDGNQVNPELLMFGSRPQPQAQPEPQPQPEFEPQKFQTPESVIPSATPVSTTAFSPIGQFGSNTLGSSIHIEAPSIPAPERKPIVSNGSSMPPVPEYKDDASNALFDSPLLNAAHNSKTKLSQPPASAASMSTLSKPVTPSVYSSVSQPTVVTAPSGAKIETIASTVQIERPAQTSNDGGYVFESAALNEQARKIANGEYTPESKASQASLSMLNKSVSEIVAKASGVSHRSFMQAPQQNYQSMSPELGGGQPQPAATYSANPLLSGGNTAGQAPQQVYSQNGYSRPVGQSSLYGDSQPVAPSVYGQQGQQPGQAPSYGSFGNANIPSNGATGVGAQNPLLAGNPLLGGGRQ